jgi:hypothetical protein
MADPCGSADRYRRYCVRSIHRCWHERADNRDDLAGPPQCGSPAAHYSAADCVRGPKVPAKPAPVRDREPARARRQLPPGDRRRAAAHPAPSPAQTLPRKPEPIALRSSSTSTSIAKYRNRTEMHAMRQLNPAGLLACPVTCRNSRFQACPLRRGFPCAHSNT